MARTVPSLPAATPAAAALLATPPPPIAAPMSVPDLPIPPTLAPSASPTVALTAPVRSLITVVAGSPVGLLGPAGDVTSALSSLAPGGSLDSLHVSPTGLVPTVAGLVQPVADLAVPSLTTITDAVGPLAVKGPLGGDTVLPATVADLAAGPLAPARLAGPIGASSGTAAPNRATPRRFPTSPVSSASGTAASPPPTASGSAPKSGSRPSEAVAGGISPPTIPATIPAGLPPTFTASWHPAGTAHGIGAVGVRAPGSGEKPPTGPESSLPVTPASSGSTGSSSTTVWSVLGAAARMNALPVASGLPGQGSACLPVLLSSDCERPG